MRSRQAAGHSRSHPGAVAIHYRDLLPVVVNAPPGARVGLAEQKLGASATDEVAYPRLILFTQDQAVTLQRAVFYVRQALAAHGGGLF